MFEVKMNPSPNKERTLSDEKLGELCKEVRINMAALSKAESGVLLMEVVEQHARNIEVSKWEAVAALLTVLTPAEKREQVDSVMRTLICSLM